MKPRGPTTASLATAHLRERTTSTVHACAEAIGRRAPRDRRAIAQAFIALGAHRVRGYIGETWTLDAGEIARLERERDERTARVRGVLAETLGLRLRGPQEAA